MRNKSSSNDKDEMSEVEELLRAAEDDMLLNLSIHSHTTRSSTNPLDADLARRFEALKMPSSSSDITKPPPPPPPPPTPPPPNKDEREVTGSLSSLQVDENLKMILGFDLSSRFAALKKPSSSSSSSPVPFMDPQGDCGKFNNYHEEVDDDVDGDGVSKKEVDKVIQWAMDAARLDPSISSDEDDDGDYDSDSDVAEEEEKKKKKKGGIKKKKE